eukprot:scaffold1637_cov410-Prasinococcus_capsulatus_cf.AAC.21
MNTPGRASTVQYGTGAVGLLQRRKERSRGAAPCWPAADCCGVSRPRSSGVQAWAACARCAI